MIGFGRYFMKTAGLLEINKLFGYRTPMSTRNKDTWAFAHFYCGRLWWRIGLGMLPLSIVAMVILLLFRENDNVVEILGAVVIGVQTLLLILPIIPTEIALRKVFDRQGNRRF